MTIPSGASEHRLPVLPAGEITLVTGRHGATHIVEVGGDLDANSVTRVRALIERLLAAHSPEVTTVVLDLSGVRVLAAAGLEALLSVQQAGADLLDLRIVASTQPVLASLRATDLAGRLRLFPNLNRALDPDRPEPAPRNTQPLRRGRQLTGQPVIEQAKGILMHDFRLDADAAFEVLKRLSQDSNTKLHDVAEQLVERHRDAVSGQTTLATLEVVERIRRRHGR